MASGSAANLSSKAREAVGSCVPAFSESCEEVVSHKDPRSWCELPEHLLLRIFEALPKEEVSRAGRVCQMWRRISQELLLGDTAASRPKRALATGSEVLSKEEISCAGRVQVNSVSEGNATVTNGVEACSKRQRVAEGCEQSSLVESFSEGHCATNSGMESNHGHLFGRAFHQIMQLGSSIVQNTSET